jgi:hypothetical protein
MEGIHGVDPRYQPRVGHPWKVIHVGIPMEGSSVGVPLNWIPVRELVNRIPSRVPAVMDGPLVLEPPDGTPVGARILEHHKETPCMGNTGGDHLKLIPSWARLEKDHWDGTSRGATWMGPHDLDHLNRIPLMKLPVQDILDGTP